MSYYGGRQDSSGSQRYPPSYPDQVSSRYPRQQRPRVDSARVNRFIEERQQFAGASSSSSGRPPPSDLARWQADEERKAFEELELIEKDVLDLVHTEGPSNSRRDDHLLNSLSPAQLPPSSNYSRQSNYETERHSPYRQERTAGHNYSDYDHRSQSMSYSSYGRSENADSIGYGQRYGDQRRNEGGNSASYSRDESFNKPLPAPHTRHGASSYSRDESFNHKLPPAPHTRPSDDTHDTLSGYSRDDLLQYLKKLKEDADESERTKTENNHSGRAALENESRSIFPTTMHKEEHLVSSARDDFRSAPGSRYIDDKEQVLPPMKSSPSNAVPRSSRYVHCIDPINDLLYCLHFDDFLILM